MEAEQLKTRKYVPIVSNNHIISHSINLRKISRNNYNQQHAKYTTVYNQHNLNGYIYILIPFFFCGDPAGFSFNYFSILRNMEKHIDTNIAIIREIKDTQ